MAEQRSLRKCPHGVNVGPLDDYGVVEGERVFSSYCADCDREQADPQLRVRKRDGTNVWQLRCPNCGKWGDLDDDQLRGRVSVLHDECGFHETRNWLAESKQALRLDAGMLS